MKIKTLIFGSFLLLFLSSISCSTSKNTVPTDNGVSYFIVGEGGGFSGTYIQYKIHINGEIEEYNFRDNSYTRIAKTSAKEVAIFFQQLESLNLEELEISSPGNLSQYIETKDHKLVWSKYPPSVNTSIQSLFDNSFTYCKDQFNRKKT